MTMYSNSLVCDLLEYIDIFLYTKITINDLQDKFNYNRYYIMKVFKKEIGITIFDYINKLKINNSLKNLSNIKISILNIAITNGFYSIEYFSEIFKKEIGISPKQYQKLIFNKYAYNEKITLVITNIINIKRIIEYANNYKNNRKRISFPVRKLSIFD